MSRPFRVTIPLVSAPTAISDTAIVRKVIWRVMPFICLCYFVACIDRSNLGVAALAMMPTLGMNSAQFGFGAGIFFVGYFLTELPANLLLVRFGARAWLARIMITWGMIAVGMAFIVGPLSLYVMRFLLGVAEAGFLPGAIVYLAFWFPASYRTRIFAWFLTAIPIAMIVGAPMSASLLYLDGMAGLHGWQWLFIIEGIPAILLGILCIFWLTETPAKADWLDGAEKASLAVMLAREEGPAGEDGHGLDAAVLRNPKTWEMTAISIGQAAGSNSVVFFLSQIVAGFGKTYLENGLLTAVPFIVSLIAMLTWGAHSDQSGERRLHVAVPLGISCVGFVFAAVLSGLVPKMAALTVAAAGTYMSLAPFWHYIPVYFRKGKPAAAAVAIINMVGSLAGFVCPSILGASKQYTGSYLTGLMFTAALVGAGALIALRLGRLERSSPSQG